MSERALVAKIDDWSLLRWSYDGAPLQAERNRHGDEWSAEFGDDGTLEIDGDLRGYGRCCLHIPATVLERLLADRDARRALTSAHQGKGET